MCNISPIPKAHFVVYMDIFPIPKALRGTGGMGG
jgi:hypothetical protein